jgi:transposase
VRATTLLNGLLDLPGVTARGVSLPQPGQLVVEVALRRQRLQCPECGWSTRARYDRRHVLSRWRHLDFGRRQVQIRALRRLCCPVHGVRTEAVPFGRPGAGFTRDFEDLVAWLATKMDKTAIVRYARIDWDTVGRICERVVTDGLDESRFDGLVSIGVDEVSWKRNHHYLTLVCDHAARKVIWGAPGKDADTLDAFFAELGEDRSAALEAVSSDMGAAFLKSIKTNAPRATRCIDPFHRSRRSPTPWTRCAARLGSRCAPPTPPRPRSSKVPVGRCSNAPTTSPTSRPPRYASYAAAAARYGEPTARGKRSEPSSPAT